jgi:protein SCO1/2
MHPRVRLMLLCVTAVVVATLGAVVLLGGSGGSSGVATGSSGFDGAVSDVAAPDFTLTDQDGRAASLSAYHGQVVILTFLYSTCRDTCPLMADQIRGALDDVGHPVPALAVSVDPVGDTPLNAKRFLFKASLTGRMRFLLGSRAQLAPVWKAYGIAPQTSGSRQSDHTAYVLLIDRRGRNRDGFPASELTPEGLAHDIRRLQAEPA